MKNLVIVVLLVVVAIAGYNFVNQQEEDTVEVVTTVEEVTNDVEQATPVADDVTASESEEVSMIAPVDMPEEAQTEMYNHIMKYNQCMMQNRLEYHQQGISATDVADKTLAACEPHLDDLKATLTANNVNVDLREGMIKAMRQRASRKLLSTIMQSLAGQAAAAANVAPGPVPVPVTP